jgi:hypothetical protein
MLIQLDEYRRRRARAQARPIVLVHSNRKLPDRGLAACAIGAACALVEATSEPETLPEYELADLFAGATLV